jgi:lipopolysaccharide export system permease protein
MTPVLAAYLSRRFGATLLFAALVVAVIVMTVNLIELARRAADEDLALARLAGMAALQTPGVALTALPFTVLLAALGAFGRLSRGSELIAMRAAGVSIWGLAAAPVAIAALTGVAAFAALNPVAAATNARFETLEARHLKGRESRLSISDEGLWLRQPGGGDPVVIHARGAEARGSALEAVTFFLFDATDRPVGRIDAARAVLEPGAWRLEQAVSRTLPGPEADGAAPRIERHDALRRATELTPEEIVESFAPPEEIDFWSLPGFIAKMEEAGFSATRHRLHWQSQLASPLLFAAMAAIGLGFSLRPQRFGGLGMMAVASVAAALTLYFITDVAKALGASGAAPVALAAWAPPAAAALLGAALLLQQEEA